jgi:hypothetical protein
MAFSIIQESRGGFCISGGSELTRQVPEGTRFKQRLSELGETQSEGVGGIAWFFGALKQFAWGFESLIDDIYQSSTENDFDYHFRDWTRSELTEDDFKEMGIEPPPSFRGLGWDKQDPLQVELIKTRFLLTTDSKSLSCPKCNSPLNVVGSYNEMKLKCTKKKCSYVFE